MSTANPIDAVEAAYDLEANEADWLRGLAKVIYPLLDGGFGIYAYRFDVQAPAQRWIDSAVSYEMGEDIQRAVVATILETERSAYGRDMQTAHVVPGALSTISEAMRKGQIDYGVRDIKPIAALYQSIGAVDACALRTVEPGGKGIILFAMQRTTCTLDARTQRLWARVAAHVAAARRLRDALGTDEAVLTPSGKLNHAEGEAMAKPLRELLRAAVLRRERARGRVRREDPAGATELWTALVSGRWSLVDHFERNGRRFVVARRNEHGCTDPRKLTERERTIAHLAALAKSNKLIAYELGLAESTVATHLAEAMRKLGVRSRIELLPLLAQLATARYPDG